MAKHVFKFGEHGWETNENIVLLQRVGSFAQGTMIQPADGGSSDIDLMGVVLPPVENILGLTEWSHAGTKVIQKAPFDIVLYDVRKFVTLALNGNPSVLTLLFPPDDCLLYTTNVGDQLLTLKDYVLGKHVVSAFRGYASEQFKKMFASDTAATGKWGDKRKRLVAEFGFDVKNACHVIRLLEMCIEFLETGAFTVRRPNAEYLIRVKTGKVGLPEIRSLTETLFERIDTLLSVSDLPSSADTFNVNELLVQIMATYIVNEST